MREKPLMVLGEIGPTGSIETICPGKAFFELIPPKKPSGSGRLEKQISLSSWLERMAHKYTC